MIHFGITHYMIYIEHIHVDIDIYIWWFTLEHKHLTWITITLDIWFTLEQFTWWIGLGK
ncbi:hypothetical protein HanRHA438_Chr07g0298361 [Helianthus annuus]|nr:hypothetical protein HanRHA438_Chr07g0298361 [Helianthus annuus]